MATAMAAPQQQPSSTMSSSSPAGSSSSSSSSSGKRQDGGATAEEKRLSMPSRNPLPLSATQEAQVREVFNARVRTQCADEIKGMFCPIISYPILSQLSRYGLWSFFVCITLYIYIYIYTLPRSLPSHTCLGPFFASPFLSFPPLSHDSSLDTYLPITHSPEQRLYDVTKTKKNTQPSQTAPAAGRSASRSRAGGCRGR